MADHIFTYNLTQQQEEDIGHFFSSYIAPCIEQYPGWLKLCDSTLTICNFIAKEAEEVVAYAGIIENGKLFKTAHIRFGPLFKSSKHLIESINAIVAYYKAKDFASLVVQIGQEINTETELSEYLLQQRHQIKYSFDKDSNWSSIILDLSLPFEDIFKKFSKGHKSAVKKAQKEELQVAIASCAEDINGFAEVYISMNKARGLAIDGIATLKLFDRFHKFFATKKLGDFMIIRNNIGAIIGGMILIYQGNTVRYYKGAINPDYRHIPILHLCVYEALRHAKKMGKQYFDFWGYNHLVDINDQRFNINIFKKGFGGAFIFYPKTMVFVLSFFKFKAHRLYRKLFLKIKKMKYVWVRRHYK